MHATRAAASFGSRARPHRRGSLPLRWGALLLAQAVVGGCDILGPDREADTLRVAVTGVVLVRGESTHVGFVMKEGGSYRWGGGLPRAPRTQRQATWSASVASAVEFLDSARVLRALNHLGPVDLGVRVGAMADTGSMVIVPDEGITRLKVASISVGGGHTCAEVVDAGVWCWGSSWRGQLGQGTTRPAVSVLSPTPVIGAGALHGVSAGFEHACALDAQGRATCWGENGVGQVSPGQGDVVAMPVPVPGTDGARQVAVGPDHSCVVTAAFTALCWGRGFTRVQALAFTGRVASIAAGQAFTCLLDAGGKPWCRGDGGRGQLGNGVAGTSNTLVPVATSVAFTSLSLGAIHACGVAADGAGYCWGDGTNGRLGNGGDVPSLVPARVAIDEPLSSIDAGSEVSCAVARSGRTWCWGYNGSGAMGIGVPPQPQPRLDELIHPLPIAVSADHRFAEISVGFAVTCGRRADSTAMCWGDNRNGAVGAGRVRLDATFQQDIHWTPTFVRSSPYHL